LVANRGEIAVRVIQGLREMGLDTVAVYSEADRTAYHTLLAHEAYPIGPAPASQSYLNAARLVETARRAGADAIHPGYGFLSENAGFSRLCEEAGIVFIGPTPDAIALMGDKLAARRLMHASGVPVIPGTLEPVGDPAAAAAEAKRIGYPVLIKAAAGGGGKGMRIVREAEQLPAALRQTMGEARSAFGNDAVYLERYIEDPKHIEVQVLGDGGGHAIHLYERECSVQRRHQKVIEESPSPSVTPELRREICAAAVRTAEAVAYRGAGTVEFVLSPRGEFYFLEMNTRLQVEHPITEVVTGVDLVRAQVEIAEGRGLRHRQDEIAQRGWALEFRIYAENPRRNFAPSIGQVTALMPPTGPGVRLDSGIYEGCAVPIHYDPLLAKLIVWGEGRQRAIARGRRALQEFVLHGPIHNIPFHQWVLEQPSFLDGSYTTGFIAEHFDAETFLGPLGDDDQEAMLAAAALFEAARRMAGTLEAGPLYVERARDSEREPCNWRRQALREMTRRR
jgi:acetyl-CoA carboxylase biotin carboxylase subunit